MVVEYGFKPYTHTIRLKKGETIIFPPFSESDSRIFLKTPIIFSNKLKEVKKRKMSFHTLVYDRHVYTL